MKILHHLLLLPLAIAMVDCASAAPAAAEPRPQPPAARATAPLLVLDVKDRGEGRPAQSVRLSVPVAAHGPARVQTRAGGSEYRISVHRSGPPEQPGPLQIELERRDTRRRLGPDEQRSDLRLEVRVPLKRGERALLGRLERPDGSSTEIVVTLR